MSVPVRLAGFVLGLAAVFGAALGVGALAGPGAASAAPPAAAAHGGSEDGGEHGGEPGGEDGGEDGGEGHGSASGDAPVPASTDPASTDPAGLQVTDDGYTLDLGEDVLPAGPATPVSFTVLDADGRPVTAFDVRHDEDLHLVAVRRDLAGYQHVHPTLGPDGRWTTSLDLTAGAWRMFADFAPSADGENRILGADLSVGGSYEPQPLPPPGTTAQVDGYTVVLTGTPAAGEESVLQLSVSRDGEPVTDLQPYLGAYGHLVVLRAGDLGYLHVHPLGEPGDPAVASGPHVQFATTAPSPGTYRLFLDFRHGGVVRTAAFTVEVPA